MKRWMMVLIVGSGVVCGVVLCVGNVYAARPFSTDDAGTVGPGEFELELGYDFGDAAGVGQGNLGIGFKHGLTEKMDIGVGFAHTFVPAQPEGLSPVSLSLKFAALKDLVAVSFSHELGGSAYSLNSAFTREFGPVEVDINLGYSATGNSNLPGSISYAIALIYGFEKVDVGCETSGD
ncbi:hypothetical protein COS91_08265, partial [Candidatus Desantisbacteria bacterium CG07_land_8_20_14_0_80_39_15]